MVQAVSEIVVSTGLRVETAKVPDDRVVVAPVDAI